MRLGSVHAPPRVLLVIVASLMGCEHAPVRFGTPIRIAGDMPPSWSLVLDATGRPALGTLAVATFVPPPGACASSLAFAPAGGREWYVAWWQPRADSSSVLAVSRSIDGGLSWTAPVIADARDRLFVGCERPGPAIAADSASGSVQLAYYLRATDGAGIWFRHSADHGVLWRAPVGVFFGDDPARTAVAGHGDTVVVAYEYPNADDARVGIAVSYTAGRDFGAGMPVSTSTESASDPRVVMRGGVVAAAWASRAAGARRDSGAAMILAAVGTLAARR